MILSSFLMFLLRNRVVSVILYTSDLKGFYEPSIISYTSNKKQIYKEYYGVFGISQFVSKQRKKYGEDKVLLVDAGDAFWGSFESRYLQERGGKKNEIASSRCVMADLMNEIGYDAYCLGNLDFDFGTEVLQRIQEKYSFSGKIIDFTKQPNLHAFKILSLNTKFIDNAENPFGEYLLFNLKNAVIKISGIVTDESNNLIPRQFVRTVDIGNEISSIMGLLINEKFPEADDEKKINILIAHSEKIYALTKAISYNSNADINIVIPSHLISGFQNKEQNFNGTYIAPYVFSAPTNSQGGNIGKIVITENIFTGKTNLKFEVIFIKDFKNTIKESIKSKVKKYQAITQKVGKQEIPTSLNKACPPYGESNRLTEETMMGHLVTDAMKSYASADISIINSLAIRNGFYNSEITLKQLYESLPFNDKLIVVYLSGSQLTDLFYHNKYLYFNYLHFSGIEIKVSYDNNGVPKDNIYINNNIISPESLYKVVMTDFLLNGGDNILIKNHSVKEVCYENKIIAKNISARECLLEYLYKNEIEISTNKRMVFENESSIFNDIVSYVKSSDYYFDQEKLNNAFMMLLKAYSLNPNDQLVRYKLARSLAKYFSLYYQGYYDEELGVIFKDFIREDVITNEFDEKEKYFNLSEKFLLTLLNTTNINEVNFELIKRSISDAELWLLLAGNYIEHSNINEAAKILQSLKILERELSEKQRAQLYTYLGVIRYQNYINSGNFGYLKDAEDYLVSSLQINKRLDYLNHAYLGLTYYKLGKINKAKFQLNKAVKTNPQDPLNIKSLLVSLNSELSSNN